MCPPVRLTNAGQCHALEFIIAICVACEDVFFVVQLNMSRFTNPPLPAPCPPLSLKSLSEHLGWENGNPYDFGAMSGPVSTGQARGPIRNIDSHSRAPFRIQVCKEESAQGRGCGCRCVIVRMLELRGAGLRLSNPPPSVAGVPFAWSQWFGRGTLCSESTWRLCFCFILFWWRKRWCWVDQIQRWKVYVSL